MLLLRLERMPLSDALTGTQNQALLKILWKWRHGISEPSYAPTRQR